MLRSLPLTARGEMKKYSLGVASDRDLHRRGEHKTLTRQKQAMVSCKLHDLYVDQRMLDAVTKRIDDIESLLYDMLK